jgi:hypothetical protein
MESPPHRLAEFSVRLLKQVHVRFEKWMANRLTLPSDWSVPVAHEGEKLGAALGGAKLNNCAQSEASTAGSSASQT